MAREIELINDRDLARKRLPIFAGMDIPSTIVRKELIDNEIDVVNERGQRATECCIKIGPNRLVVMDNGSGISTKVKEGTDKTHLWLACAKMFSSSNYSGVSDSVGANGVGMTIANYTSKRFTIALVNANSVQGYSFMDGFLLGTDECKQAVQSSIESGDKRFTEQDAAVAEGIGDFVAKPYGKEEGVKLLNPYYQIGFMVDAEWHPGPNELFPDVADINWLLNYTKARAGELASAGAKVTMLIYADDQLNQLSGSYVFVKDPELDGKIDEASGVAMTYLKSWSEQVADYDAVVLKEGPWKIALSANNEMKVESIVQGAPIKSRYVHSMKIDIQDYSVSVNVPVSIYYNSAEYPAYQDQTKTSVRFPYSQVARAFERSGDVYRYFYREAEKSYMRQAIKDSDSNMFWPCLGDPSQAELIIAEGYSAISGLKSQRNPMTQACIALRGKILNCWNLDIQKAMRAEVVKQILNAVMYTEYKRIIIATDEDADGSHICSLLLALFARFTNLIEEGKVYRVHSPKYLFKKRNAEMQFSDNAADCPNGYHVTTLKGLGGMTEGEVERFIMNEETRSLIKIKWDEKAYENLDHAFSAGCEGWIEA